MSKASPMTAEQRAELLAWTFEREWERFRAAMVMTRTGPPIPQFVLDQAMIDARRIFLTGATTALEVLCRCLDHMEPEEFASKVHDLRNEAQKFLAKQFLESKQKETKLDDRN